MSDLISIIVPVYGVEKYLRQCVESVLAQTYSCWELILVDDGSTDGSPLICDEYAAADQRITVVHQENGGLSFARNSGLARAKGCMVTFLDADDTVHPEYLRILHDLLLGHNADVSCVSFTTDGAFDVNHAQVRCYDGKSFTNAMLYQKFGNLTHSAWGKLYRREILPESPFTIGIGYEDLDALYRIFPGLTKVVTTSAGLYFYRQNTHSYLHTFNARRADVLDVTDRIAEFFSKNGAYPSPELYKGARDRRMSAHFNIFCLMSINGHYDTRLENRCWNVIKKERISSVINPEVRFKNKAGALLSFFGKKAIVFFARFVYR